MSQTTAVLKEAVNRAGEYCHAKGEKIVIVTTPDADDVRFRCIPSDEIATDGGNGNKSAQ
jgi:hypothetical protein